MTNVQNAGQWVYLCLSLRRSCWSLAYRCLYRRAESFAVGPVFSDRVASFLGTGLVAIRDLRPILPPYRAAAAIDGLLRVCIEKGKSILSLLVRCVCWIPYGQKGITNQCFLKSRRNERTRIAYERHRAILETLVNSWFCPKIERMLPLWARKTIPPAFAILATFFPSMRCSIDSSSFFETTVLPAIRWSHFPCLSLFPIAKKTIEKTRKKSKAAIKNKMRPFFMHADVG